MAWVHCFSNVCSPLFRWVISSGATQLKQSSTSILKAQHPRAGNYPILFVLNTHKTLPYTVQVNCSSRVMLAILKRHSSLKERSD